MRNNMLKVGGMFGDYGVVRLLGAHGNVDTYQVRSASTGRMYVMRIFLPDEGINEATRSRFAAEVEKAMTLRQNNLVQVYDFGEDPDTGLYYIVMDYVGGGSLADRLRSEGALAPGEAVQIALDILHALDAAHRAGSIHTALTADNVLFDDDGTLKIANLGIANTTLRRAIAGGDGSDRHSISAYTAPELVAASSRIDGRVDIYSAGIILFEMIAGTKPPPVRSFAEHIVKAANNDLLPDIRSFREDVKPAIAEAIATLAAADAARRPATAAEAANLLRSAAAAELAAFARDGARAHGGGAKKGGKGMLAASVAAVLLAAAGGAGYFFMAKLDSSDGEGAAVTAADAPAAARTTGGEGAAAATLENDNITDPLPRSVQIGDVTWHYTIENGKAILWRGKDSLHGPPCMDPAPAGDIVIPDTIAGRKVGGLGALAFFGCAELTGVKLPESVETIGNRAFLGCTKLKELKLPKKVRSVGMWAFNRCSSIKHIDIAMCGRLVTDGGVFSFCPELEQIKADDDNPAFTNSRGVLYSRDMKTLVACPPKKRNLTVPETVTHIGDYAFCACRFESLTLPETVRYYGEGVFKDARIEMVTKEWKNDQGKGRDASLVGSTADTSIAIIKYPNTNTLRSCSLSRLNDEDTKLVKVLAPHMRRYRMGADKRWEEIK